jgi:hypothetical protein
VSVTAPLPTDQDHRSHVRAGHVGLDGRRHPGLPHAGDVARQLGAQAVEDGVDRPGVVHREAGRAAGLWPGDDKYLLADGSVRNYVYRLETPLASSSLALQRALFKLDATSNRDLPEASFEAIGQVLTCDNIGWREKRAQGRRSSPPTPSTTPTSIRRRPTGTSAARPTSRLGRPVLRAGGRHQVHAREEQLPERSSRSPTCSSRRTSSRSLPLRTTARTTRPCSRSTYWRAYQQQFLGFGAVVELSDNSDNLDRPDRDGADQLQPDRDAADRPTRRTPSSRITTGITNGMPPQYTGVKPGQTVDFKVTLGSVAARARPTTSSLCSRPALARRRSRSRRRSRATTARASPAATPSGTCAQECAGDNTCVGCDGVPFSGKVNDMCKVCGGANLCETDCTASGQASPDKCGVCGGTNLCLGCDGVPNSLAQVRPVRRVRRPERVHRLRRRSRTASSSTAAACAAATTRASAATTSRTRAASRRRSTTCAACAAATNACFCDPTDNTQDARPVRLLRPAGRQVLEHLPRLRRPRRHRPRATTCAACAAATTSACRTATRSRLACAATCAACAAATARRASTSTALLGRPVRKAKEDTSSAAIGEGSASSGLAVGIPLALLLCAALIAGFFIYKQRTNPYWSVPASMLNSGADGLAENPLYSSQGGFVQNPLHDRH